MGYRGKIDGAGAGTTVACAGQDAARHRDEARRQQVVGVALGPRRPLHAVHAAGRTEAHHPSRRAPPSVARSRSSTRAGVSRIGTLGDDAFLAAGVALYAGEGSKADGECCSRTPMLAWSRSSALGSGASSTIDEARLAGARLPPRRTRPRRPPSVTGRASPAIPRAQFRAPYRAVADPTIRTTKHEHGCVYV